VGFRLDVRPDRRHVSSTSRDVVVAKVRELERQRDSGTVSETSTPTVAWWLEHWLTTIAPRRVRRRTLEGYESAVRKHLIPGIGRHRIGRLRPEHLDQLYTALLADGYSPASVPRHHRHPVPGPHRRRPARARPPQHRHPRRPARPAPERGRHRPRPRRGTRCPRGGRRRAQLRPLDGRPRTRAAPVRGPRAAVEGHRPARRDTHRAAQHPPRPRRAGLRGTQEQAQSPHSRPGRRPAEHRAAQLGERLLAGSEWHDEDLVFAQANGRPIDKKTDYDDWTRLLQSAGTTTELIGKQA
jgi:integrase